MFIELILLALGLIWFLATWNAVRYQNNLKKENKNGVCEK